MGLNIHDTLKNHKVRIYKGNGTPMLAEKVGRNEPCPCGSGKKAKNCCGTETKYYNSGKGKE